MKQCPNCDADVINGFEICWNCNYSFTEECIIEFNDEHEGGRELTCLRCTDVQLLYTGTHKFHEGPHMGMGGIFSLFLNKAAFDIYICPKCGKAEFYTPID